MRVCIVLASIVLTGCAGAGSTPPVASPASAERFTPYKLDPADIAAIQAGAKRGLKDPDSAKFGEMHAGTNDKGVIHVCLAVNAKNSYGGYTGMKPHIGILTTEKPRKFVLVPDTSGHPEFHDQSTLTICEESGLALAL